MFSSAAVKFTSGDPTWRNLTALQYHYETQCLPPWTAWYAHHLPASFQRWSAIGMFAIEGIAPFLIVAPRRIRMLGAAVMALLQVLIFAPATSASSTSWASAHRAPAGRRAPPPARGRAAGADPRSRVPPRRAGPGWITGTVTAALVLSPIPLAGAPHVSPVRLARCSRSSTSDPPRHRERLRLLAQTTTTRGDHRKAADGF
jgi:hypothetical protein